MQNLKNKNMNYLEIKTEYKKTEVEKIDVFIDSQNLFKSFLNMNLELNMSKLFSYNNKIIFADDIINKITQNPPIKLEE